MPIPALGLLAGAAIRFPKVAEFVARNGKYLLAAAAGVALVVGVNLYLNHRDQANYDRGYAVAEKQAQDLVDAANERERVKQRDFDLITQRFAFLAESREGAVTTIVQPQIERITHEIQNNPVYSACVVTPGVFDATNTAIAGVNASIAASAPAESR